MVCEEAFGPTTSFSFTSIVSIFKSSISTLYCERERSAYGIQYSVSTIISRISEALSWQTGEHALQKTKITVADLLKYTLKEVEEQRKNIVLRKSSLLKKEIFVDAHYITKAFKEIIQNAFFFRHPERKPRLTIIVEQKGHYLCFGFQDNGQGIDQEHWFYIFAPLYVVSQSRNRSECGIGCGLTFVRGMVEAHGGQVYVGHSEVEKGTLFIVELPVKN